MEIRKIMLKGGVLAIGLAVLLCVRALAEGNLDFNQTNTAYRINDISGNPLGAGADIQALYNAGQIEFFLSRPASPDASEGALTPFSQSHVGDTYSFNFGAAGRGNLVVRTWQATKYASNYGYQTLGYDKVHGMALTTINLPDGSAGLLPSEFIIGSFGTTLKREAPPAPNISAGLPAYAEVTGTLRPYVTINISNSDPTGHEVTGYHVKIWKTADPAQTAVIEKDVAGGFITDPATEVLDFGTTYEVSATAKNWYGQSGYKTPPAEFSTVDIGFTGGPQTFHLTLESGVPDKPGINFFAMPFGPEATSGKWYVYGEGGAIPGLADPGIQTAYDLVKAIDLAAGVNIVSTFGKWDRAPAQQQDVGVPIPGNDYTDATAAAALQAINLAQGEGYQVYITQGPVRLVIKNSP